MPNLRKHFMYGAWAGMVNRCHNENNSSYKRYGGRGTIVCDRWRYGAGGKIGFACFLDDMGERPNGMTLDRIDPLGHYEPANCRWADIKTQRRNISARGDARMRAAMSVAVKARWERWRQDNALRPELTPNCQRCLHALADSPQPKPTDGRYVRPFESLVALGFAALHAGSYEITDTGAAWLAGGRPQKRAVQANSDVSVNAYEEV